MENVPMAPQPVCTGYAISACAVKDVWVGGLTERVRRFSFGGSAHRAPRFVEYMPLHGTGEATITGSSGGRRRTPRIDGKGRLQSSVLLDRKLDDLFRLQGLPTDFLAGAPFTTRSKMQAIGNGVPLPMGRAIARAVKSAIAAQSSESTQVPA
jgi:DNA (cytosine-5)-methyltransferase 1